MRPSAPRARHHSALRAHRATVRLQPPYTLSLCTSSRAPRLCDSKTRQSWPVASRLGSRRSRRRFGSGEGPGEVDTVICVPCTSRVLTYGDRPNLDSPPLSSTPSSVSCSALCSLLSSGANFDARSPEIYNHPGGTGAHLLACPV
ncbi:unnamed protein product [Peniophora sp. CBMAI 1063]|nr:unnamed protein product [Peniophora sp. CBMAI 1063]